YNSKRSSPSSPELITSSPDSPKSPKKLKNSPQKEEKEKDEVPFDPQFLLPDMAAFSPLTEYDSSPTSSKSDYKHDKKSKTTGIDKNKLCAEIISNLKRASIAAIIFDFDLTLLKINSNDQYPIKNRKGFTKLNKSDDDSEKLKKE